MYFLNASIANGCKYIHPPDLPILVTICALCPLSAKYARLKIISFIILLAFSIEIITFARK